MQARTLRVLQKIIGCRSYKIPDSGMRKEENNMSHVWQLQEAQNKLSEVIDNAEKYGAQIINYQGKAKGVMLSMAKYRQLINPKNTLVKFFQQSPLYGVSLDLERDKDTGREINLE